MAYTIPQSDDSSLIDQEFDLLDWRIRIGHLDKVREICAQILTSEARDLGRTSWARILCGTIELLRLNYEDALRNFEASNAPPAPLRPRAKAGAAKSLTMLGHIDQAGELLQALVSEWPNSWYTWEASGLWHRKKGDDEAAWRSLLKASALNPGNPSTISTLIAMGLVPNRYHELVVALESHLAIEPLNLGFRGCLVNCFLHTGELDKACDQARRIVLFAPFSVVPAELVSTMHGLLSQVESS